MKKLILSATSALVVTVIFGTIEVVSQQSLRMAANDPQIQMAEDAAIALNHEVVPATLTSPRSTFPGSSLAPFLVIYDKQGNVVAGDVRGSAGEDNIGILKAPLGVLTASEGHDYNFVTWQPEDGIRIAAVTVTADKYYVLAGRSLKEVEMREKLMLQYALFGWLTSLVIIMVAVLLSHSKARPTHPHHPKASR